MIDRYKKYTAQLNEFTNWSQSHRLDRIKLRPYEFIMTIRDRFAANLNEIAKKAINSHKYDATVYYKGSAIGRTILIPAVGLINGGKVKVFKSNAEVHKEFQNQMTLQWKDRFDPEKLKQAFEEYYEAERLRKSTLKYKFTHLGETIENIIIESLRAIHFNKLIAWLNRKLN